VHLFAEPSPEAIVTGSVRRRFWVEVTVAGLVTALAITTLVWRDWFEAISGEDPDHGDGSLEWLVTGALAIAALLTAALARREWHRSRPARAAVQ
jgi:hypothetical protein